jgi:hypothetical protein
MNLRVYLSHSICVYRCVGLSLSLSLLSLSLACVPLPLLCGCALTDNTYMHLHNWYAGASGAKERQFLQDLLQPLVEEVMDAGDEADMETDPIAVRANTGTHRHSQTHRPAPMRAQTERRVRVQAQGVVANMLTCASITPCSIMRRCSLSVSVTLPCISLSLCAPIHVSPTHPPTHTHTNSHTHIHSLCFCLCADLPCDDSGRGSGDGPKVDAAMGRPADHSAGARARRQGPH